MIPNTYFLLLGAITVVVAQLSEYQPEESPYSYNEITPANDPNNPWANYQQQAQQQPLYSSFSNVNRQDILNNPEAVGIVAVAVVGAVALGATALSLADARETNERLSQRQAQICSDGKATAGQLTTLARQILMFVPVLQAQDPPFAALAPQLESSMESIISSIPTISC
ncbi:uncharacterized protein LOC131891848 [Tigriopus californicus]|uniref:uncharacterized protein LOC131891848 n=1 Tax=Tigriopus californicus TaxID=6832 RepID=UPI0027D9EE3F|nr:uncharacterized protein LOC131891848 [Tigriopus californicus]